MSTEHDKSRNAEEATRGTRDAAALAADLSMSGHTLPAGTVLQGYRIQGLLGECGFGTAVSGSPWTVSRDTVTASSSGGTPLVTGMTVWNRRA